MRILRDNGLTLVLVALTLGAIVGLVLTGWSAHNEELNQHGERALTLLEYGRSGPFLSALFENWESEFLQMAAYVMLTAFLFQRGSAESKDPDRPDVEAEYEKQNASLLVGASPDRRRHGLAGTIYSYSLGIALSTLFVLSFVAHLAYSANAANTEAAWHGQMAVTVLDHFVSAEFWFESLQNWQSEFLSTAVIVVLSIFLRFRGSPESKPVAAPDSETGS